MESQAILGVKVSLFDIVMGIGKALDCLDSVLANHHARVACFADSIAVEMGLSVQDRTHVLWAGLLHDIGSFSARERLEFLDFDLDGPQAHAEIGHRLVRSFAPLAEPARLIRYHHVPWQNGAGRESGGMEVPLGGHILHLADRVAVGIVPGKEVLSQVDNISKRIVKRSGRLFNPDVVDAFLGLAAREVFWFEGTSEEIGSVLGERSGSGMACVEMVYLLSMAQLFCKIIDFRSPFTATHSKGVAVSAERLASKAGFSVDDCGLIKLAGYMHDIGKIAIPVEILDKPGRLTPEEWNVVKMHPFVTYRILKGIVGLESVASWAAFHHERPDGQGYPFHLSGDNLPMGARILAVADVFTALAEERPYRQALPQNEVLGNLLDMAKENRLDFEVVRLVAENYEEVNSGRIAVQKAARDEYQDFMQQ